MTDRRRILSIDGGGIRGLIPAVLLDSLEAATGKPARESFDFVAGPRLRNRLRGHVRWVLPGRSVRHSPPGGAIVQHRTVTVAESMEAGQPDVRVASWATIGRRAKAWRVGHAAWSVVQLGGLGYIWACAISRRRTLRLWAFVGLLLAEGGALLVGRGNCPMGRLQAHWGDPVPFFELVLRPRAAKAAVPILALTGVAALVALVVRPPLDRRSPVTPGPQFKSRVRSPRS